MNRWVFVIGALWTGCTYGDSACDHMSMVNGVVMVDAEAICLGAPCNSEGPGLYLGAGTAVYLGDIWRLESTDTGFTISNGSNKLLSCAAGRCFAGSNVVSTYMDLSPGLYVGYEPYTENINGVWMAESVLRFVYPDGTLSRKMKVRLLADSTVTGTMTLEGELVTVELMTGMRVVGNATSSSILNNLDWATELVAGNVVINTATFIDSCRPASNYLSIPPAHVNGLVQIRTFTSPSHCGRYHFRQVALVADFRIDPMTCYASRDYPWFGCPKPYFTLPDGCGDIENTELKVTGWTSVTCTGDPVPYVFTVSLGCTNNVEIVCYDTN